MSDLLVSDTIKKAFNIAVEFIKDNPSTSLSIMFTNYSGDLVAQQWNEGISALRSILNQSDISLNGDEMARLFHVLAADITQRQNELQRCAIPVKGRIFFGYKISSEDEYKNPRPADSFA
jgi:hypothetical protein